MAFAVFEDFTNVYGEVSEENRSRAEYFLGTASARLAVSLPGLEERAAADSNIETIARDVVVQAAIRQFDPTRAATQFSQSAGPYSMNINTGARVNRGMFYSDELELLEQAMRGQTGIGVGTLKLGRTDWTFS